MIRRIVAAALFVAATALAQTPSNLVVEGVPAFPDDLVEKVRPYLDARAAAFRAWNPARPEMLISTRFGDTSQLHIVKMPGGARKQITFYPDAVGGARFRPGDPNTILFSKDAGGNEFFQIYRYDVPTGTVTMLTDGKSRNTGMTMSRDGKWLAYSSTRRNGKDTDIYVADPMQPQNTRRVLQVEGGGWILADFSPDATRGLVMQRISANESEIYLLDLASGEKKLLTPKGKEPVSYGGPRFLNDREIVFTTDEGSEFQQLVRMQLADGKRTVISREKWDVEDGDLSHDGRRIAYVTNENGISRLHVLDLASGRKVPLPQIPAGVISGIEWHPNNRLLGFTLNSAKSPSDAYSIDVDAKKFERWTESETGGLNPALNAEPELVTMKSFDGVEISAFVHRPDPAKFPGRRPSLIVIHGGPEGQSRPGFLGRNNYWINEMGIALIFPNVRGSSGYGKTFLALDNGFRREDSVKDIGRIIEWIRSDPRLDGDRIGVYGGSYGGYMVLASMVHFNELLRTGIDVVGISHFLTFLKNTADYRRDLRRVEYGDERDPKMREHLERISPLTNISKITKPLFVIAGQNDPRVPWTEGEQIVKAVRATGAPVWWLMAKDEGHGFARRKNQDYQFLAMTLFLEQYLVK
ncbi:MAG TPA: prolyl oligopeptidase family serine peptidase [Thermoanaerobaculia bacterium]|nr:prolyl oligopeptidase family serine peptidase [Thermoanaerobaculia bacterium]